MERQNEAKIKDIIRLAMAAETPPESVTAIADFVFSQDLALATAWAKEKLATLARSMLAPKREPDPLQAFLPGMETLPANQRLSLSRRLPLKDGKKGRLGEFSVIQVREAIALLKRVHQTKLDPTLEYLQELANGMSPYSEHFYKRGEPVTVARYVELKAAGTPVPVVRTAEQRSAQSKQRWAGKTRRERSAIARRRAAKTKAARG